MQCCVETRELQHSFTGNQPVIDQVSLPVPYILSMVSLAQMAPGKRQHSAC